ncbi:IclR family transcriptional regulator [Amycolatopsis sp. GM8]|uniref:IclR family transcriptional regulator n=1 Tax=Amycolatopsis sp. GM8 TaxID=2896530 RepID=UPI001F30822B|nr:IclR family transcriptional regulator [Amycolatopsis sp. GM8]
MTGRADISRESGPPMTSVDNALRIVMMLGQHSSVRVSDVASQLGISVSTAHRLLSALVYRKFAEKDPTTHAYSGGTAGRACFGGLGDADVLAVTRPYLERLSRELRETTQLLVLQGKNVKFIAAAECTQALRTTSRVGLSMPAHCSSGGKVLLADLEPAEFRALHRDSHLPSRTQHSITNLTELEAELTKVRRAGYAMSLGEGEPDVAAVAVAIRNSSGRALAAMAASGPRSRMPRKHMIVISESLAWAARQIAGAL